MGGNKGGPKGKAGQSGGVEPSDGDHAGQDWIMKLPDELLLSIARFYNPPIPFQLGHFTLSSRYIQDGRTELRALVATCKRFAKVLRPVLYRTMVFIDDKRRTKTVNFYHAKETHDLVKEMYWQPSYLYNDMSPLFLPLAKNLTYLVLAFLPQDVPDDFIADDYAGLTTLTKSFTDALRQLKNLSALEIPFWESRQDKSFHFGEEILPALDSLSIGDWQEWDAFEHSHKITTVKWLIHPDIDMEEGLLEGFNENLAANAKYFQFSAHSGWGRTDLPEKLPDTVAHASWYKDIKNHPLESLTLHGFNPITSYKEEWAKTLPSFLSLLQMSNLHHIAFIDVPSLRNSDRVPLNWDDLEPLQKIDTVQISLATEEDVGKHGGDPEQHDEDGGDEAEGKQHDEMSQRIAPDDLQALLRCFPNIKHLTLANFHRCKKPEEVEQNRKERQKERDEKQQEKEENDEMDEDEEEEEDPIERFAEDIFQPAARDFVNALGLLEQYDKLEQVIFRSVEAELVIRFRRGGEEEDDDRWHEELRRLY
ncbi:RHTO0S10e03928g1_1 [Rhodotorula toruloides]|uniref:RHTO0S10e03928g1_1 n=1 Tax=Rhodotorula toruloides TaxID=5286 RepID=A0A061B4V8_RHOTO|nr:RHTO0S10e03928g1_1 [Rhodotorula toruloides]